MWVLSQVFVIVVIFVYCAYCDEDDLIYAKLN